MTDFDAERDRGSTAASQVAYVADTPFSNQPACQWSITLSRPPATVMIGAHPGSPIDPPAQVLQRFRGSGHTVVAAPFEISMVARRGLPDNRRQRPGMSQF
jgi:hypothetical protein